MTKHPDNPPARPVIVVIEPPQALLDAIYKNPCNFRAVPMSTAITALRAYAGIVDGLNSDRRFKPDEQK